MKLPFKNISFGSARRRSLYFWIRHYKSLFTLSFVLLSAFVGYQWHRDLYRYHWTEDERKAYLETTAKETAFQEKKFLEVLDQLAKDRAAHQEVMGTGRDLFEGARKKEL